jgi:hypothetical protein
MLIKRTFALADIILRAHILNPFWKSRDARRARRCAVATEAIPRYLKRYVHPGTVKELPAVKDDAREKAFMFWGFRPKPPLVDACVRSAEAHLTQQLLVLNEKTLYDYIELPDIIMDKQRAGNIAPAHFMDICRVELLHNHGGFWMDATGFISAPIPQQIVDEDFFVYLAGKVGSPYSFIQNCFIRGRKNAYLLEAWRAVIHEFWKNEPREFDYFMHQLRFKALVQKDPVAKKYFDKMPHIDQDPTHALWWTYGDKPFDQKKFDELTGKVFFQKTTYNSPWAKNPPKGSFADVMINEMYK